MRTGQRQSFAASGEVTAVSDGTESLALHAPRSGQFKDWLWAVSVSAYERVIAAADIAGIVHVWQFNP